MGLRLRRRKRLPDDRDRPNHRSTFLRWSHFRGRVRFTLVTFPGDLRMLGTTLAARPFLERVAHELLRINPDEIKALADAIYSCYEKGRFVFIIGNGGSGSNSSHFCEDLGK